MLVDDVGKRWTVVHLNANEPIVRRYPVPGGWIYQVSIDLPATGDENIEPRNWHTPIFIPSADAAREAARRAMEKTGHGSW